MEVIEEDVESIVSSVNATKKSDDEEENEINKEERVTVDKNEIEEEKLSKEEEERETEDKEELQREEEEENKKEIQKEEEEEQQQKEEEEKEGKQKEENEEEEKEKQQEEIEEEEEEKEKEEQKKEKKVEEEEEKEEHIKEKEDQSEEEQITDEEQEEKEQQKEWEEEEEKEWEDEEEGKEQQKEWEEGEIKEEQIFEEMWEEKKEIVEEEEEKKSQITVISSKPVSFDFEKKSEIEAKEEYTEEEEEINRESLIEEYMQLQEEKKMQRRKNRYLHKKVIEYLKKRKLDMLQDPSNVPKQELQENFQNSLTILSEKLEWYENKKKQINSDLNDLQEMVRERQQICETTFDAYLKRERDVSVGVLNTKTGNVISEQTVERYMTRKKQKMKDIADLRLCTITLEAKLARKEELLKSVESLGDNLCLTDYEQLTIENTNLTEKVDERENELGKLYDKYTSNVQILAHLKEKGYATTIDIHRMEQQLKNVEYELFDLRESVNKIKILRDSYRAEARSIKETSGLLTQTRLLRDFEKTNKFVAETEEKLARIRKNFEREKNELHQYRKTLEDYEKKFISIMKPKLLFTPRGSQKSECSMRSERMIFSPKLPPRESSSTYLKSILQKRYRK